MKHTILYRICLTIACIGLCLTSCSDDEFESSGYYEGDGRIVKVNIPYKVTGQSVQTRVWESQMVEDRVHELRILVFRIDKDKGSEVLVGNHLFTKGNGLTDESVATYVPTGTYRIIAISNLSQGVMDTHALDGLVTEIEATDGKTATTFDEFKEKTARIVNPNPLTRLNSSLVMMGELKTQPISREGQTLSTISLRRLDAAVRFTFTPDTEPQKETLNGETVISKLTSFKLTSWKVCRVPTVTKFYRDPNTKEYITEDIEDFTDTPADTYFDNDSTPNQFSFYLLENNFTPKDEQNLTDYHKREMKISAASQSGGSDSENTDSGEEKTNYDIWKYANPNSTYVVVTASMDFTITPKNSNTSYPRHAEVTYTIHLGYTTPKTAEKEEQQPSATDFRTLRNTRYYYNVKVKGVNSIIVEAKSEKFDDDGFQHGTEGTVIDSNGGENIRVDAHYAAFNIMLTPEDIKGMDLEMYSPVDCPEVFKSKTNLNMEAAKEEFKKQVAGLETYQALRIAKAPGKDELANYSDTYDVVLWDEDAIKDPLVKKSFKTNDAGKTTPLYDYFNWKKVVLDEYYDGPNYETPKADKNEDQPLYWTVFINEYVYYDKKLKDYIEAPERYWHFHSTDNYNSMDGQSHYAQTRYAISQRAIQTPNDFAANEVKEIVGWEQVNEHQYKKIALPALKQSDVNALGSDITSTNKLLAGWQYTWKNLTKGKSGSLSWTDYLPNNKYETLGEGLYTFKTGQINPPEGTEGYIDELNIASWYAPEIRAAMGDKKCYNVIDAVLSRNRDLNRNGTVDEEELRWFLPTDGQYIECAIGGDAMPSPLIRRSDYTGGLGDKAVMIQPFHFVGSNYRQLWADQGFSTGSSFVSDAIDKDDKNKKTRTGWNFRCARYVSDDHDKSPKELDEEVIEFYTDDKQQRVITCKFPSDELRAPTKDYPVFHGNFSRSNWTPRQFQYANRIFKLSKWDNTSDISSMLWNLNNNYYGENEASKVSPEDYGHKVGPWRVANQRELAILTITGALERVHEDTRKYGTESPAIVKEDFGSSQYASCTYATLRQEKPIADYRPNGPVPGWCIKSTMNNNMAVRPMSEVLSYGFCLILVRDILEN